ncbi:MAG: arginase family protein [Candidatus Doudnabacteria bacterium]|nr:arginase family protein [Candidatus Doudnabacteria bacterium]
MDIRRDLERYLRPPGAGRALFSTGLQEQGRLSRQLLGVRSLDDEQLFEAWRAQHLRLNMGGNAILGLPFDTGSGSRRGSAEGPNAMLRFFANEGSLTPEAYRAFQGAALVGDVRVVPQLLHDDACSADVLREVRRALYDDPTCDDPVAPLSVAEEAARRVMQRHSQVRLIALIGDHSGSYAIARASIERARRLGQKLGVVHFDAHTDMVDYRLGVKWAYSTWAYWVLQELHDPRAFVQIGIRATTKSQAQWQAERGMTQFWAPECLERGADAIADDTIAALKAAGVDVVHIDWDIDGLDAAEAPATGTPEPGGYSAGFGMRVTERIGAHFPVVSGVMAEVAPFLADRNGARRTLNNACELVACMMRAPFPT